MHGGKSLVDARLVRDDRGLAAQARDVGENIRLVVLVPGQGGNDTFRTAVGYGWNRRWRRGWLRGPSGCNRQETRVHFLRRKLQRHTEGCLDETGVASDTVVVADPHGQSSPEIIFPRAFDVEPANQGLGKTLSRKLCSHVAPCLGKDVHRTEIIHIFGSKRSQENTYFRIHDDSKRVRLRIRQAQPVGEQLPLMRKLGLAATFLFAVAMARADQLLPTADGTTWQYDSKEEFGGPTAAPAATSIVTLRVGRQTFDGKEFIKFETLSEDSLIRTELVTVDDQGIICHARGGKDGRMVKLDPPQTIVRGNLKVGDSWDSEGEVAGMEIRQHFTVTGEELVRVPAGSFRALHIHCEDSSVMSVALDRWFVAGLGFVKETTVVRGPTGGLLQRNTLELQKRPEVIARPTPTPTPEALPTPSVPTQSPPIRGPAIETQPAAPGKKLIVEVSTNPAGGSTTEFKSDVENIYVRWHGRNLPKGATVRVAWIAEDVGDLVEPNFIVDETETVAPEPDSSARFTLGRPPDGWAEGKYRLEFYVNDELEETLRVTISN